MPTQSPQEQFASDFPAGPPSRALNRAFAALLLTRLSPGLELHGCPGQTARREPSQPPALPLVQQGVLEVLVALDADGRRVVPVWFEAGEIGLLSTMFGERMPGVELVWRRPGTLRWLPRAAVEAAVLDHPPLLAALTRFLAQRLREVQLRERGWLQRSVHDRVRAVLGRSTGGEGGRQVTLTHGELSEHCGVSRPKLSVALKALERAGALRLHRGRIEILRPEAFQ